MAGRRAGGCLVSPIEVKNQFIMRLKKIRGEWGRALTEHRVHKQQRRTRTTDTDSAVLGLRVHGVAWSRAGFVEVEPQHYLAVSVDGTTFSSHLFFVRAWNSNIYSYIVAGQY